MNVPSNVLAAWRTINDYLSSLSAPADHLFCIGEATMFALNWNGSIDRGVNGIGAWGAHTANKSIMGVSLPEGVLIATAGLTGTWKDNRAKVGEWLAVNRVQVDVTKNGKTLRGDIVDAGPSRSTHNCIDLTYAMAHGLETNGRAVVSYSIIISGQKIPIKGWDFENGVEIAQPGVA